MSSEIISMHQSFLSQTQTPVDVIDKLFDRLPVLNEKTGAFIRLTPQDARTSAAASRERYQIGQAKGCLDGVPIGLKDLIETEGVITTAGSRHLEDHVPAQDAEVVERLRLAGANIRVGKLNLHEFAYGPTGTSSHWGPMRNPYDLERMAGGSSGGSGIAVALGGIPATLGTDTGGSIRIPAAFCGISGFKGSYDRVSRHGVIPLSWTLDHIGPLARTVYDIAVVMDTIAATGGFVDGLSADLGRIRVFVPSNPSFQPLENIIHQHFTEALRVLTTRLPYQVEEGPLPFLDEIRRLQSIIIGVEASTYHQQRLQNAPEKFQPDVRERLQSRWNTRALDYAQALKRRQEIMRALDLWLESYDVMVLPTVVVTPPRLTTDTYKGEDIRGIVVRNTSPFNLLGLPALSIPMGLSPNGLPTALQIVGRRGHDTTVLAIGERFQQVTEFHRKRPNLAMI